MEKENYRITEAKFDWLKDVLISKKRDFDIETTTGTKSIITNDTVYKYVETKEKIGGVHLIGMMRKAVEKRQAEGFMPPEGLKEPIANLYQIDNIKKNIEECPDEIISVIDLRSAYWTAAYRLGYISADQYYINWHKEKWKGGMVASIGALNKSIYVDRYVDGVLIEKGKFLFRDEYKQNVRLHIVNHIHNLMRKCASLAGDSFFFIQTDAIAVAPEYKHISAVFKAILDAGFVYSIKHIVFKEVGNGFINYEVFPEFQDMKTIKFSDRNIFF